MKPEKPEFDSYAENYAELLRDPIRERFVKDSAFFMQRKWELLSAFFAARNIDPGKCSWLDVGCGQGDLLKLGASAFSRVAGCDLSPEMMESCDGLDVRLQTDPTRLPFESGEFDMATAVCVYHHVPPAERARLTSEVVRTLKPGGIFCIIEHNPFNPATRIIVSRTPVDADAILLTASETQKQLGQAGLTILHSEYFLYLPEGLYRKMGFVEKALSHFPGGGQYAVFARKPQ